mmetsp:Transcript_27511/g.77810  ORF Transcript_27511/g.77810 Transcript_27511/m.77810 type:complete len:221 (-) Transcript_27511:141-803(-)
MEVLRGILHNHHLSLAAAELHGHLLVHHHLTVHSLGVHQLEGHHARHLEPVRAQCTREVSRVCGSREGASHGVRQLRGPAAIAEHALVAGKLLIEAEGLVLVLEAAELAGQPGAGSDVVSTDGHASATIQRADIIVNALNCCSVPRYLHVAVVRIGCLRVALIDPANGPCKRHVGPSGIVVQVAVRRDELAVARGATLGIRMLGGGAVVKAQGGQVIVRI